MVTYRKSAFLFPSDNNKVLFVQWSIYRRL